MFISLCKKIKQQLKEKKAWRQVLAYGILAFLIMQCYVLPFASENTEAWESVATIGDGQMRFRRIYRRTQRNLHSQNRKRLYRVYLRVRIIRHRIHPMHLSHTR